MHLEYKFGINGWYLCFQGYDPLEKEKFIPKYKKKGRSSAGGVERRKKKVAHEDQRVHIVASFSIQTVTQLLHLSLLSSSGSCKVNADSFFGLFGYKSVSNWLCPVCHLLHPQDVIRRTVEDKMKAEKERKQKEMKAALLSSQKAALDRFKK